MKLQDYIPTDPFEIEHVIDLLREDLRPEYRKMFREGKILEYGVLRRLREALTAKINEQVTDSRQPRDWSDFAHMASSPPFNSDWLRALASAVATLYSLERASDRRDGLDPDDDKLEWLPEWDYLRTRLIEVALYLTHSDLIDEEKRRKRAEKHAAALGEAAARARPLIERQGRNTKLPKTEYYISLIEQFPSMTNRKLAHYIFDNAPMRNDGESHFYWLDRSSLIDRKTGKPITIEAMTGQIQKAKSEHVNGRKHKAKKKVR